MRWLAALGLLLMLTATADAAPLPWPFDGAGLLGSNSTNEQNSKILTAPVVGPPTTAISTGKVMTFIVLIGSNGGVVLRSPLTHW